MNPDYRIIDVVPHGAPMSLLDKIESHSAVGLVASVTITSESMFCEEDGVPAWVGIEYMGQAVAAWAGVEARLKGKPVKIGFLVSARRYISPVSHFCIGETLQIAVEQITDITTGLGVFDCRISIGHKEIQANLNVFMPENIAEFLEGKGE
ncbi:MAG: hypothetical protein KBT53_03595 [Porticoccus sp.]|nr:hypothetical protein [Porticoccus sp.]MBQ0806897.1 hypothetical protein [Porticoccus sp.]